MTDKPKDPMTAWRDMLGEWEKNVNAFANKSMESEDFAKVMGQATGATSTAQAVMGEAMQKYLTSMNLPSRADLTNIGERLQSIEAQLRRLVVLVHSMNGGMMEDGDTPPKPTRGRKPPAAAPKGGSA